MERLIDLFWATYPELNVTRKLIERALHDAICDYLAEQPDALTACVEFNATDMLEAAYRKLR